MTKFQETNKSQIQITDHQTIKVCNLVIGNCFLFGNWNLVIVCLLVIVSWNF